MSAEQPFFVDRAKGGRAACKGCKEKCQNAELRMAKVVPSPYGEGQSMKSWFHVDCLMNAFLKQRPTTKRIDFVEDIGNWNNLTKEDQSTILEKLNEMEKTYYDKHGGKFPLKVVKNEFGKKPQENREDDNENLNTKKKEKKPPESSEVKTQDDNFDEFVKLCKRIARVDAYTEKTAVVNDFFERGTNKKLFEGDVTLWCKLLLPGAVKRVYNLKSKQLVKLFSRIFNTDQDDMLTDLEQGDIADTIETFFSKCKTYKPATESTLTVHEIDEFLEHLSNLTKEDEQIYHFKTIIKRCTLDDLRMIIRLIKGDLRINAGPKHILEGVHPDAYSVFQTSRDIEMVMNRVLPQSSGVKHKDAIHKTVHAKLVLMTPVLPMLAEACKSVEMAMKKCPNGMFSEIKYDGERVQVHKKGKAFKYFSRSLKPVMPHKVSHFKDYLPQAFPKGEDLVLDAEVLMIDVQTGKPLPFGTLGIHKQTEFKDAQVCLFVFDCLYYNGDVLTDVPIWKRRKILEEHMVEVNNHVMFSETKHIKKPADLANMIAKVLQLGLEGLVLKDLESTYEPGKRHWLKVKKDYLFDGAMADTADLVVLGAWFGSGKKGGMMSVFLMGCYDERRDRWLTVTKVHTGHDDKTLEQLQDELAGLMVKISQDSSKIPAWLNCSKGLTPDFVAKDPKEQPVWEITGTEFTKANIHTADGISVRFPRVTRIRSDKNWKTATNLEELKQLFKTSKEKTDVSLLNKLAETATKHDDSGPPVKKFKQEKESPKKIKSIDSYLTKPVIKCKEDDISINSSVDSDSEKTICMDIDSPIKESPKSNNSLFKGDESQSSTHHRSSKSHNSSSRSNESSSRSRDSSSKSYEESSKRKCSSKSYERSSKSDEKPSKSEERLSRNDDTSKSDDRSSKSKVKLKLSPDNPLPDVFKDLKVALFPDFISFPESERRHFERHWIAYGGKVIKSVNLTDVDYVVHKSDAVQMSSLRKMRFLSTDVRHVTKNWLISCINERKLCDTRPYIVSVQP